MRISDWSSDVCSSDLVGFFKRSEAVRAKKIGAHARYVDEDVQRVDLKVTSTDGETATIDLSLDQTRQLVIDLTNAYGACRPALLDQKQVDRITSFFGMRSEEHTSELQSLMRISYAVFCLKKKTHTSHIHTTQ